jgi:serine protein kinase
MESIVREIARELKESQVPDKYRPISFEEYLKMVFEDPRLVRNAYQRLYDMILSHGTHIVKVHDKEVIRYNFFDDPFSNGEDAIYGIDEALKNLVDTLCAAAKGLGPDRRIILLHGPVATSKSTGSCASPTVGSSTAKSCSSSKKSFSMIFCMPPKSTSSSPRRTRA